MGNILSSILSSFYLHLAINSYNIGISQNHIFMRSVGSWPRFPNPLTSARKEEAASETQDMGPALAFRFGYKDWFDFSFRLGSRKSSHKPTAVRTSGPNFPLRAILGVAIHGLRVRYSRNKPYSLTLTRVWKY